MMHLAMEWPPERPVWKALSAAAVMLLIGVAGMALSRTGGTERVHAEALPVLLELARPAASRCPLCGWIESKKKLAPDGADPHALQTYEYTVRRADGSSRVFLETLPVSWRLGERLMVIDGTGPPD